MNWRVRAHSTPPSSISVIFVKHDAVSTKAPLLAIHQGDFDNGFRLLNDVFRSPSCIYYQLSCYTDMPLTWSDFHMMLTCPKVALDIRYWNRPPIEGLAEWFLRDGSPKILFVITIEHEALSSFIRRVKTVGSWANFRHPFLM